MLVYGAFSCVLCDIGGVTIGRQKLRQKKVLNSNPLEIQFSGGGNVFQKAATVLLWCTHYCLGCLQMSDVTQVG